MPDSPVPSTIREYIAEQDRLLAVAAARRESPRPNATTTVCNTLEEQAIRRLSERVREAIDVSIAAADACASNDLFGDTPAQTNVLRIERLETLHKALASVHAIGLPRIPTYMLNVPSVRDRIEDTKQDWEERRIAERPKKKDRKPVEKSKNSVGQKNFLLKQVQKLSLASTRAHPRLLNKFLRYSR